MFAPHAQRSRAHFQPFSNIPHRADYSVPTVSDTHLQVTTTTTPRSFAPEGSRSESYPDPCGPSSRKTYDPSGALPHPAYNNQPYDRHPASPPDLHLPYRLHYSERHALLSSPKRPDIPPMEMNFAQPPHSTYDLEPDSLLAPSSSDSDFWEPTLPNPKQGKSRREKPKIALAPDQPPTTQGKPRARVYVACVQCRTRKIRCDGGKPTCHNCGRRNAGSNECSYDPVPKRRGPDKTPGARQRVVRDTHGEVDGAKRRRRRNTSATDVTSFSASTDSTPILRNDILPSPAVLALPVSYAVPPDFAPIGSQYARSYSPECGCHGSAHCPDFFSGVSALPTSGKPAGATLDSTYHDGLDLSSVYPPLNSATTHAYIAELDENNEHKDSESPGLGSQPSINFARKVWWDSLLYLYHSTSTPSCRPLTSAVREDSANRIAHDLRWIFKISNYWFSFFHIPTFFSNFYDPNRRENVQPSLVLSLLAISTFFQSSEVGFGRAGRERALRFQEEALGALEASFNSGWIDETLAQAGWLLALFEICAHDRHSSARSTSAMIMLDSIIRSLSLTMVNVDDDSTTLFPPGSVPAVGTLKPQFQRQGRAAWFPDLPLVRDLSQSTKHLNNGQTENSCSCNEMTLGEHWPSSKEHAPLWGSTPAWNEGWSEAEIRKESCRRLCWSSMMLAAGHISYTIAHRSQGLDLFISDPANYALLFSGESVARSPWVTNEYSSKDTIWALHDRSFLLWHGCIRMRNDTHASNTDKAHFSVKAWLEADTLEEVLNRHTCGIEKAFIFQAREYVFNTRMCISYEFQRFIPLVSSNVNGLFHRNKAVEWLNHQATVAERFMAGLHTITGNLNNFLAHRPFFIFWFMGQISRSLSLWQCDSTLAVALDVCKALLPALDYLTALWPCAEQRRRYVILRERVGHACFVAGTSPLPPLNLSLLPSGMRESFI